MHHEDLPIRGLTSQRRRQLEGTVDTLVDGEHHLDGDAADTLPAQPVTGHLGLTFETGCEQTLPTRWAMYMEGG